MKHEQLPNDVWHLRMTFVQQIKSFSKKPTFKLSQKQFANEKTSPAKEVITSHKPFFFSNTTEISEVKCPD